MSGASTTPFQHAMEQVKQRVPFVTTLAIEHALRDCDGDVEATVNALKRFTRHQSYPQGMSLDEQNQAETGIHYSHSFGESDLRSDLKRGYSTMGPGFRYPASTRIEKNLMSLQQNRNDMNIIPSSTDSTLDSSQPINIDGVDSVANAAGNTSPRLISKLSSVDEAAEPYDDNYLSTRQERLDSLRKTPSLDDTIGAQKRQLEALDKRIEMLNQQTDAFKDETISKQQRLQFLQSRHPSVNKFKIDEQSSLLITLEDDVAQLNDNLMYLKKEVEGKWQCAHCTFLNFPLFTECELCHFKKDTVPLWRT